MSNKNRIKNAKRNGWVGAMDRMRPAFTFHSRYAGLSEEEIRRQINIDAARAAVNAPEVGRQRSLNFGQLTREDEMAMMRLRGPGLPREGGRERTRPRVRIDRDPILRAREWASPPEQHDAKCVIPEEHIRERMEMAQMRGLSHFTIASLEMLLNSRGGKGV